MSRIRFTPTRAATEVDWIRLAAFVDGEGCITGNQSTRVVIHVANTSTALMRWLADCFGGSVHKRKDRTSTNNKQAYLWTVVGVLAADVLFRIRPYLIIKGEQADIAMRLGRSKMYGGKWNAGIAKERTELLLKIRALNMRGFVPLKQDSVLELSV